MDYLAELLGLASITLAGWLHMRQNDLATDLKGKVDKDAFQEVKEELDKAVEMLTDLRVENARWQGIVERAIESNSRNS